ncbi:AMP-binding protein [Yoonia sp. 208BN28-4]|uniref:AMP-binding protein n=1 Tax=Yoonia sp. 208BN28-4 TaxID=3126505 RepID=UPI0030B6FC97
MTNTSPIMVALRDASVLTPDAPAVIGEDGGIVTYAKVMTRLEDITASCAAAGLTSSHRVATLLPDTADTALFQLAVAAHHSLMPLNPSLTDGELAALVQRAHVDLLVADGDSDQARRVAALGDVPVVALADMMARRAPKVASRADGQHDVGLTLLTSGSTGLPKMVRISPEAMLASAHNIIATLSLGPDDRALHALPMFHIGAVVDLLLVPLLSGGSTVVCAGRGPADLSAAVTAHQVTWMQLVPTMLTRCLADCDAATLQRMGRDLDFIRMVSADLSADLQHRAEQAFGTPLIQMYGMTETAGQICSNPRPPAQSRATSVGLVAGPEVAILDAHGGKLPAGREGEVCVRGDTVFDGYEGQDKGEAFFNNWFRTGDLGRFDDDGYLFLTGRKKEMINQGGEKISPLEIERVALSLDGVTEAASYPLAHPTLGEQPGLSVVSHLPADQIMAHLRTNLAHYKLPRTIDIRAALPRLGGGKVDKLALIRAAETETDTAEAETTWTGTALVVAGIWADTLNAKTPGADTDFFDAGGDSLSATTFILAVEKKLGTRLDPNILFNHPTFGGVIAHLPTAATVQSDEAPILGYVRRMMAGWPGSPTLDGGIIRSLGTAGDAQPIFWCGTGSDEGLALQEALGFAHPIYTMLPTARFPGRNDADRALLADTYVAEIAQIAPDGPLVIGGFCDGGRIMELVADRLVAAGREIRCFISGDYWFKRPTAYPVFHIFSRDIRFSAAVFYQRPELAFGLLHPVGANAVNIDSVHHLNAQSLAHIANRLRDVVTGDHQFTPFTSHSVPFADRGTLHHARLRIKTRRFVGAGEQFDVIFDVQNRSALPWGPTSESGISLAVHAFNFDNYPRQYNIGYHDLEQTVMPGQSVTLTLRTTFPDKRLPMLLRCVVTDQGICDFSKSDGGRVNRLVLPKLF